MMQKYMSKPQNNWNKKMDEKKEEKDDGYLNILFTSGENDAMEPYDPEFHGKDTYCINCCRNAWTCYTDQSLSFAIGDSPECFETYVFKGPVEPVFDFSTFQDSLHEF